MKANAREVSAQAYDIIPAEAVNSLILSLASPASSENIKLQKHCWLNCLPGDLGGNFTCIERMS